MSELLSSRVGRRKMLKATLTSLVGVLAAACGGPTPTPIVQIVEKTRVVEVQKKETVEVQKVVEKPVVVTATPAPTVAGSDLAADQTARLSNRNYNRMDPAAIGGASSLVSTHLWMQLFHHNAAGDLIPWLATKYEASPDLKTYTVHLDPRAVWSDGTPVTAQEAKDYWVYALHIDDCKACYLYDFASFGLVEGAKDVRAGKSRDLGGVVVKDAKTIEFRLTGPDPLFPHRLCHWITGFAKMEDVKKGTEYARDGTARVNGPFMIKTWDMDKKLHEVVRNPKWWGDRKPKLSRVVGYPSGDGNIQLLMWQNNEVDMVQFFTATREVARKGMPEAFKLTPYAQNWFYRVAGAIPPTDDINVRRALFHAVPWDKAVNAAWEGSRNNRMMTGILTPELTCFKKDIWPEYGFDPAKAKAELAKSKYSTPDKLGTIRIQASSGENYIRLAEVMAEQWKQNLGITSVEIKPNLDGFGQDKDKVQIQRSSAGETIHDPANMLSQHWTWLPDPKWGSLQDEELGKALADLNIMRRDDPKFCEQVQKAEARMLSHHLILPALWDVTEVAIKPWVKDYIPQIDQDYNLLDIYIVKH